MSFLRSNIQKKYKIILIDELDYDSKLKLIEKIDALGKHVVILQCAGLKISEDEINEFFNNKVFTNLFVEDDFYYILNKAMQIFDFRKTKGKIEFKGHIKTFSEIEKELANYETKKVSFIRSKLEKFLNIYYEYRANKAKSHKLKLSVLTSVSKVKDRGEYLSFDIKILSRKIKKNTNFIACINNTKYKLNKKYSLNFIFYRYFKVSLKIDKKDLVKLDINNGITLEIEGSESAYKRYNIKYQYLFILATHKIKNIITFDDTSFFIRSADNGLAVIVYREFNYTDLKKERAKIAFAYFLAKILPKKHKNLIFEKKSMRYQESGKILYEGLLDRGYENSFYIIDRNSQDYNYIEDKYKKNIIHKYSFAHYLLFFRKVTLISSEMPAHGIDLRVASPFVTKYLEKGAFDFIFLQHGVTLSISLNSPQKDMYKRDNYRIMPRNRKIVVDSEMEIEHFIEASGYKREDLIKCGILKFDTSFKNKDADKIIIMPTWRPFEYSDMLKAPLYSAYFKMIERIYNALSDKDKERAIILPHPLFRSFLDEYKKRDDLEILQKMDWRADYDEILREADILITDYSSVSFDAFYRGAKVIFYWEEKDECMKYYKADLKINKENAFGSIAYNTKELREIFDKDLLNLDYEKHTANYRQFVEFFDGKNTERLIDYLEKNNYVK